MTKNKKNIRSMGRKKRALGRGLDALFPEIESIDNHPSEYFQCDVDIIRPNRYQPRVYFSENELAELARSIEEQGVIQPLMVRKNDTGYELVAGERRFRAAKMAGLSQVPVIIRELSDKEVLEISIVENIQREDLNAMEEAEAYHRLITEFNLTQDKAATRVGKSRSTVANFLRLRNLPEQIKTSIAENLLSMGHARAILGAETPAQQNAAWKAVVSNGLSVRQTESLIKRLKLEKKKPKKTGKSSNEIYFSSLEDDLTRRFGTKVKIKRQGQKGKVEIDFYSNDDLDRLLSIFKQDAN